MKYLFSLLILAVPFTSHASSENCTDLFSEELPYAYSAYNKTETVGTITLRDIPTADKSAEKKFTRTTTPVYLRLKHISQNYESSKVQIASSKEDTSGMRSLALNGPRNEVLNLLITIQMSEGISTKELKTNIQKFMDAYPLLKSQNEIELLAATQLLNGI